MDTGDEVYDATASQVGERRHRLHLHIKELNALINRLRTENQRYELILNWLVALDEPGSQERRTVTLNQIIERARETLELK